MDKILKNKIISTLLILIIIIFSIKLLIFFTHKKEKIVIAEIKDDLTENYLNYIDKPSWITNQALRLIIPPLIDYQHNCYPYSELLKQIPSKDNNLMFLENKQTVMIIDQKNFQTDKINIINIIPTVQILNMENISAKWIHKNLVDSIDQIDQIQENKVRIRYKLAYSLPYFPSPVIFDNPELHKEQILSYTYKNIKNYSIFPKYSYCELQKSQTNNFIIKNKKKDQEIHFITYTNIENLKKDVKKIDLIKIPPKIEQYLAKYIQKDYKIIRLPNKEIFFIFFNPQLKKEERLIIYLTLKNELSKYNITDYQLNNTYILPYHFAAIEMYTPEELIKPLPENNTRKLKIMVTYKDEKSKLISNLIEEIVSKKFNSELLKINIEKQLPKKEIFGVLVEPPEPSIKDDINPYNFDLIITSVTFLPYMNYFLIYSKDGKYNIYSVSTSKIEELLNKVMSGLSIDQKDYLIELQKELSNQFLIVPLLIDTQTLLIKKDKVNHIKINPINVKLQ
ncbi:MAG: hypothetical protein NZM44_03250 [Candidatus Calescibacterium sp.]|nr:hypothetical protein [Candidatus Calescibacterium sp.]